MKKLSVLLLGLLVFSIGNAFAFPLWPGVGTSPGTMFQDDNRDYLMNLVGNADIIDIGDVLVAAIEFPSIEKLPSGSTYSTNQGLDELVAISTIQLKAITADPLGGTLWWFGEYNDGNAATDDSMVKFYSGLGATNLQLNADISLAASTAAIIDGTFLWSFSITADEDTFWSFKPSVTGANSTSAVNALNASTKIGPINYALMQTGGDDIFNSISLDSFQNGLSFLNDGTIGDGLVDMYGSGDILGGGNLTGGAFARSDIDTSVNPTVIPEPATLSLFGLSLIGLAFVSRRRSRR